MVGKPWIDDLISPVPRRSCQSASGAPGRVAVAGLFSELDAVVCQDRMDLVGGGFDENFKELPGCSSVCPFYQLGDRKLAGAVNGHEHVKLAFGGLDLGDIHVEEPDQIGL